MNKQLSFDVNEMKPDELVKELDKYIIGQDEAKKSLAIAVRNRYRRSRLPGEIQEEIAPSNIIMIGSTGVGKTEIVRRASKLIKAPFVKVEATKYTEVGYVGRDVESMVRDLSDASYSMIKSIHLEKVQVEARKNAEMRILDILIPPKKFTQAIKSPIDMFFSKTDGEIDSRDEVKVNDQRKIFLEKLKRKELENELIEIELEEKVNHSTMLGQMGMDQVMDNMNDMLKQIMPSKRKKRKILVKEAREYLAVEEAEKLIDEEVIMNEAVYLAENYGIIFIDEIDKIAETSKQSSGVSREGVQRDILPIVEGSVVKTKYGNIKTDYILFIAAGAFHVAKPQDLIPELQGRFPIRVELNSLKANDYIKVLTETDNSLIKQYTALLEVDNIKLVFTEDGIVEIAKIVYDLNETKENLGARRLLTVLEQLLKDTLFEIKEELTEKTIDRNFVQFTLRDMIQATDISRYIL